MTKNKEPKASAEATQRAEFLHGEKLTGAIQKVVGGADLDMAVAFWGVGADGFLGLEDRADWRVICNLAMGGTNPEVIRLLENPGKGGTQRIKEHKKLHAKVYVSDAGVVAASANMSKNGLGLEGAELAGWMEAGFHSTDKGHIEDARAWFRTLLEHQSQPITNARLDEVMPLFLRDRGGRPQSSSVEADAIDFPLMSFWFDARYEVSAEFAADPKAVEEGYVVEHDDDRAVLKPGRWLLWWKLDGERNFIANSLAWRRLGEIAEAALRWEGGKKWWPVALADLNAGSEGPVALNADFERRFLEALKLPEFRTLSTDYTGSYFTPRRQEAMRRLWKYLNPAPLLIECNHKRRSNGEWPNRLADRFDWSDYPDKKQTAAWEENGVWIWPEDELAFQSLPVDVLHFDTPDWSRIDWRGARIYRVTRVLPGVVTIEGKRLSLGVTDHQRSPTKVSDEFAERFEAALEARPEIRTALGLGGVAPKWRWSRSNWFPIQITNDSAFTAFWDLAGRP